MSRMFCLLRFSAACLCFLLLGYSPALADLPRWDAAVQGKFVTSLTADTSGRVWAGTEENGVWVASGADADKGWTHYGVKDGLGQDDVSALVCDTKGRIWAGHRSAGISVFNGQAWKSYDAAHGPLGSHVFALAVSPKDGDVWIGTDAGLTRYSAAKDTWRYYTRAEHLPSDQIQALAFDAKGTLYVGTQCDGLAIGTPTNDYASWQHLIGPTRPGISPSGPGFPDCRITALLATRDGSVYAGTPTGLAGSQDGGKSWTYLRGKDWYKKVEGRTGTVPTDLAPAPTPTLAEDYVSALAEDSAGRLWIGHSAKGVEVADTAQPGHALVSAFTQPLTDDVRCLLASAGPSVLAGGYGSGLAVAPSTDPNAPAWHIAAAPAPAALPSPAAAPTAAELKALLASVPAAAPALSPGTAVYLGEDWQTQGDWVGRYGHQYADLCGTTSPVLQPEVQEPGYEAFDQTGPHYKDAPSIYSWIGKRIIPERRFLYSPTLGSRREAEVNDGSWQHDKYPMTYEGPDLWVTFTVPAGAHRASFYFVNNDGHQSPFSKRNYFLEMKADKPTLAEEDRAPALASARVADFYHGVYKQFLVMGPGTFHLKIGRSYSECTKLQGVFLDKIPVDFASPTFADPQPIEPVYLGVVGSLESVPGITPRPVNKLVAAHVLPGSPAQAAGFLPGDVLLTADGHALPDPESLPQAVQLHKDGDALSFVVMRGTKRLTLIAILRPRPAGLGGFPQGPRPLPSAFAAYAPPAVPPAAPGKADTLTAARALWSALDTAEAQGSSAPGLERGRVLAYRAALAAQAPPALLANWRWQLGFWSGTDHADFDAAMQKAHTASASQ